ncbi:MAG TPA: acetylornithine/succinylornithine family transaminase [Longimicrobiales bacterium]|nr:acetylornithine/succinylornithine family transaminase [Longimicrobiales bacterium]
MSTVEVAPGAVPAQPPQAGSPLLGVYRQPAPVFVEGRGSRVYDAEGQAYLDFISGIGVNAFGYGDPGVAGAIRSALETGLIHLSNLYRTAPAERLAGELTRLSFADRVFFCNSGGEATEAAFKFARRKARESGDDGKIEFVALHGSFHGRLFGSLAATDRPAYREPFEPLLPGVRFIPVGDVDAAAAAISRERTAGIIVEPVQGEGGVRPIPAEFLAALRTLAEEADAVLIFDEVQCGLGRTGYLFAYEATGVVPDILTLAKPLAGGLPMGAVLMTEAVASAMRPGDHGTTFGGGPLVSAVALEVVRRVSAPEFLAEVRRKGEIVSRTLRSLVDRGVAVEARGRGLMWGLELAEPAAPFVARAFEAGLLLGTAGERVIRLLPPLTIEDAELNAGLGILEEVLA